MVLFNIIFFSFLFLLIGIGSVRASRFDAMGRPVPESKRVAPWKLFLMIGTASCAIPAVLAWAVVG